MSHVLSRLVPLGLVAGISAQQCAPGEFAAGEPWQVVMKSNGDDTWQYSSALWGNTELLNENDPELNVRPTRQRMRSLQRLAWCSGC